jgi:hypothetical protein
MYKSIITRFLKGIIAGAVSAMVLVTFAQPTTWDTFPSILNSLGLACAYGGLTGFLLALQKYASWTNEV